MVRNQNRHARHVASPLAPLLTGAAGFGGAAAAGAADFTNVTWNMLKDASEASLYAALGIPLSLGAMSGYALSKATEPSITDLKNQQRRLINARLSTMLGENLRKKHLADRALVEAEQEKKRRDSK